MKKQILNLTLLLTLLTLGLFYYGCDTPAPTELVLDNNNTNEEPVDVEIITKDTQDEFYSNGFDSTGVALRLHNFGSVIVVTGSKISKKNTTVRFSLAEAAFFDKNKPVSNMHGGLIGFHTFTPGTVRFNGIKAKVKPLRIKYKNGTEIIDTTLGSIYVLFSGRSNTEDPFNYNFRSNVSFELKPTVGHTTSFKIPTPQEITGKVTVNGKIADKNLRAVLEWDGASGQKIEIILGAVLKGSDISFPLYRLRTKDDGKVVVPHQLLNTIPFDRFDKIVFSFVRRLELNNSSGGNSLKILSQSIHSIIIDLP